MRIPHKLPIGSSNGKTNFSARFQLVLMSSNLTARIIHHYVRLKAMKAVLLCVSTTSRSAGWHRCGVIENTGRRARRMSSTLAMRMCPISRRRLAGEQGTGRRRMAETGGWLIEAHACAIQRRPGVRVLPDGVLRRDVEILNHGLRRDNPSKESLAGRPGWVFSAARISLLLHL